MAVKTFSQGEVLSASDTNTFLANSGTVYVAGGTFTNVAAFNVTGFSSTYQTYVLQLRGTAAAASGVLGTLYNGATARNSLYYGGGVYGNYVGGTGSEYNNNNTTFFTLGIWNNLYQGNVTLNIFRVASTQPTWNLQGFDSNGFNGYAGGGFRNSTDSWDTISVSGAAYNLTGTWRLYGYREP